MKRVHRDTHRRMSTGAGPDRSAADVLAPHDLEVIAHERSGTLMTRSATKGPWQILRSTRAFLVAGAGFEPAIFGL